MGTYSNPAISSEVESKIGPTDASLGYDLNLIVGQRSPAMNPQQPLFLASSHIREEIEYHQSRHPDGVAAGVGMEVLSAEDASKREQWNLAAISPRAALKSSFLIHGSTTFADGRIFRAENNSIFTVQVACNSCRKLRAQQTWKGCRQRGPPEAR